MAVDSRKQVYRVYEYCSRMENVITFMFTAKKKSYCDSNIIVSNLIKVYGANTKLFELELEDMR